MTAPSNTSANAAATVRHFERHVARLLIVLYTCGQPVNTLFEGEMRQIESKARLHRLDFWLREPGHLALALLAAYTDPNTRPDFEGKADRLRAALDLLQESADAHRVVMPGAVRPSALDPMLAFLTARALVADRPSFTRGGAHRIVLEQAGLDFVPRLLSECPSWAWYRTLGEAVNTFLEPLERIDLATMPYLAPDLTPASAAVMRLQPVIRERYARTSIQ